MSRFAVIAAIVVVITAAPGHSENGKIERSVPDVALASGRQWEAYSHVRSFGPQPGDWDKAPVPKLERNYSTSPRSTFSETPSERKSHYDSDLVEAAKGIFGPYINVSNESERQRWLYEEQKARDQRRIENEINRSKPLIFPVSGH